MYCSVAAGVKLQRLAWLGLALLVVARKWGCSRKSGTERPERHAEFPRAAKARRLLPGLPVSAPHQGIDRVASDPDNVEHLADAIKADRPVFVLTP
jgi:hypothetical protein